MKTLKTLVIALVAMFSFTAVNAQVHHYHKRYVKHHYRKPRKPVYHH